MSEKKDEGQSTPAAEDYAKQVEELNKKLLKAEESAAWAQRELEKAKTVKADRDKMLDDKAKEGDPDAIKKIKDEAQNKIAEIEERLNKQLSETSNALKHERVTKGAIQAAAQYFNDDALDLIETKISKHCDWEDGQIVIKDEKGEIRYSETNRREKMTIDEFMKELASKYPSIAKPTGKPGTQQPGHKTNSNDRTVSIAQLQAMTSAEQSEAFKKDPNLAREYLRTIKF